MNPHTPSLISLDGDYEIADDSWIVIVRPEGSPIITQRQGDSNPVTHGSLAAYGITGKTTQVRLRDNWLTESSLFGDIRGTVVYAKSEELTLAEAPVTEPVRGGVNELIELDGLYQDLEPGRWVVVSGEREIEGTEGVSFSELAMLAYVTHDVAVGAQGSLDGDKLHTFVSLAKELAYQFKWGTVRIDGNVVKATHGETRREVLGSGDGAKALQSFLLKQAPLTHVSASNPTGVDSTLEVYVNDVRWHEEDTLAGLSATDRSYIAKTDDDGKTTVVFGNGQQGARLPSGMENVKAAYRSGIGRQGNVKAEQITLLTTRPLGVKEVSNPLPASGGANRETRDQARRNAPLAVMALDRLVSVQDYEDFSRTYGGVGKARAVEISDGRRQLVHVTIAGADDIPIDESSDLYRNLYKALRDFGDPYQPIRLVVRELMLIVISARVRILPDYQWERVIMQVRGALLDAFSFDRRELGQDVLLSEVINVIQAVRGVAYVDVDIFGGLPERQVVNDKRELLSPHDIAQIVSGMAGQPLPPSRIVVNLAKPGSLLPAQMAFLSPDVPETLVLNQIT